MKLGSAGGHVVASTSAAAAFGWLLGLTGAWASIESFTGQGVILCIVVAYAGAEIGLWRLPLPQTGRQVPAQWRYRFPQSVTATLYGLLLGPGLGTRVASFGYVPLLLLVASLHEESAAVAMGMFGLTRAGSVVAVASLRGAWPDSISIGYKYWWLWRTATVVQLGAIGAVLGAELSTNLPM